MSDQDQPRNVYNQQVCELLHGTLHDALKVQTKNIDKVDSKVNSLIMLLVSLMVGILAVVGKELFASLMHSVVGS